MIFKIRKDLHDKLLDLPVSFYDRRKSGEIASRVVEDVQMLKERFWMGQNRSNCNPYFGRRYIHDVLQDPALHFVFLPLILVVLGFRYVKVSKKNWQAVREASGDLNSLLVEDIQGNRLIRHLLSNPGKNDLMKLEEFLRNVL